MHYCQQLIVTKNGMKRCESPATFKYKRRYPQKGWKYVCKACDDIVQSARKKAARDIGINDNT